MDNPQAKWGFRWENHLSMGRFGRVWLLEGMLVKWQVFPPRISTISHALSFLWATRASQLGMKPLLAMKFDALSLYLNAWVTVLFCFLIFTSYECHLKMNDFRKDRSTFSPWTCIPAGKWIITLISLGIWRCWRFRNKMQSQCFTHIFLF